MSISVFFDISRHHQSITLHTRFKGILFPHQYSTKEVLRRLTNRGLCGVIILFIMFCGRLQRHGVYRSLELLN